MIIQPIITPDNAEETLVSLMDSANQSIDLELQYIKLFSSNNDSLWPNDENPLIQAVVRAIDRGVKVRIILNAEADNDNASVYLTRLGAQVRFLDLGWDLPSWNHNKGLIIDNKTVVIASINWSKNSLRYNREAGVIIHDNPNVANYYLSVFDYDWERSSPVNTTMEIQEHQSWQSVSVSDGNFNQNFIKSMQQTFSSPKYTGIFNVTTFVGPDSAYDTTFTYLETAQESIHVEIYSISLNAIVNKLISLKENNPSLDIKVIISDRRVSYYENINTWDAALRLVQNGIFVYNSSDQFNYQHSKFWIIDGKYTFIYSGNWARSSMPDVPTYPYANREWGIVINNQTISDYYEQVFSHDLSIAKPFKPDLLAKNKIIGIRAGSILSGIVELQLTGQNLSLVSITVDDNPVGSMNITSDKTIGTFTLNTVSLTNGIHTLTFHVLSSDGSVEDIAIEINVINNEPDWKLLITEILYNAINEP